MLAQLNGQPETSTPVTRSDRIAERAEDDVVPPRSADATREVAADQSPLIDPDPKNAIPVLAAGIDLETYAAPPVAADPDAQLVSTRRPVSALRLAREALRSESNQATEQASEEPPAKPSEEPPAKPIDAAIPDLPEALPEDPFASDSPDPFQGLEPRSPARDDEKVRPTSVLPEDRPTDRTPDWVAQRPTAADAPSLFEPTRLSDRLGMRVQRLRDRLTPNLLQQDRAIEDASAEGKGFPRLFRRQRDGNP